MLSSVEQAFVGRDEKRAPLKTPAWEATTIEVINKKKKNSEFLQNPCKEILVKNKHSVPIFVYRVQAKTFFGLLLNEW